MDCIVKYHPASRAVKRAVFKAVNVAVQIAPVAKLHSFMGYAFQGAVLIQCRAVSDDINPCAQKL